MPFPELTDQLIRAIVGTATFERGQVYFAQGRVEYVVEEEDGTVSGVVRGSARRPYEVVLLPLGSGFTSWCSCPMEMDCKHVAAVAISLIRSARQTHTPRKADWERTLGGPSSATASGGRGRTQPGLPDPLALRFEVASDRDGRRRLKLTVHGRTKSGTWSKSAISWSQFSPGYGRSFDRHPAAPVLTELQAAANPDNYYGYGYGAQPVYLDAVGPGIWRYLNRLTRAGVSLVSGTGPTSTAVRLIKEPLRTFLDLRRAGADVQLSGEFAGPVTMPDGPVVVVGSAIPLGLAQLPEDAPDGRLTLWRFASDPPEAFFRLISAPAVIPADELPWFLTGYLPTLREEIDVISSDDSVELLEPEPPRLRLHVKLIGPHRAVLEWFFDYPIGDRRLSANASRPSGEPFRNPTLEQEAVQNLPTGLPGLDVPTDPTDPISGSAVSGRALVDVVAVTVPALRAAGVEVEVDDMVPDYREAVDAPVIELGVSDSDTRDWFDLAVRITLEGIEIPFAKVFQALAIGEPLILDDGLIVDLDRPEFHRLAHLIEQARLMLDPQTGKPRLSVLQAGLWEELVTLGVVTEQSQRWRELVTKLQHVPEEPVPVPVALQAELRPYQQDGFGWLCRLVDLGLGGVLADDMGLGKTVQGLALMLHLRETRPVAKVLVVAPTSVVGNWVVEAGKFAPGLRVTAVTATGARRAEPLADLHAASDVVITSYALLRLEDADYRALDWDLVILDEAQQVKNRQSKAYQAVRRLNASTTIAMTGTPLENSMMDLWSMLSLVAPGMFPDPERFRTDYALPIESGRDPELLAVLRGRIRPFMLRRTKDRVALDLPAKQEQVLTVELAPQHQRAYQTRLQRERQLVLGLLEADETSGAGRIQMLAALTRLRRLALSTDLVEGSPPGIPSAKIELLVEHLVELAAEGHRALVFSQFTDYLKLARTRLDAEGIRYSYLDGRTRNRQQRIAEFVDGDAPAFLISLKAGGFGLNLTAADYVFILDPWWNPAAEAQAIDRTHRIGQDKPVMVYRLISADTIEQKVLELQETKRDLFRRVVDESDFVSTAMGVDDLRALLD